MRSVRTRLEGGWSASGLLLEFIVSGLSRVEELIGMADWDDIESTNLQYKLGGSDATLFVAKTVE